MQIKLDIYVVVYIVWVCVFLELGETSHHAAVVCKLAKIWFIMQYTLPQINAVSTFS